MPCAHASVDTINISTIFLCFRRRRLFKLRRKFLSSRAVESNNANERMLDAKKNVDFIAYLFPFLFSFFFNPDRALTGLNGDRDEIRSRRSTDSIPRPTLRDECLSISRHRALNSSSAWTTSSSRSKFPLERKRDERERESS